MNCRPLSHHDPRHSSAQGPVLALTAILSLGMSGQQTRCPARAARAIRPRPAAASIQAPALAPNPASSWMDYIDFRRGSGDALTNLGGAALSAARPRHPTPDS